MPKIPFSFYFLTVLFIFIGGIYVFRFGGSSNYLITNILYLIPPFLAVISGVSATVSYSLESPRGKTLLFLTLGLLSFFIGEAIWFYLRIILNIDPYPSVADIFFLSGYPLLLFALLNELKLHRLNLKAMSKFTKALLAVLVVLLSLIVFYFGVFLAYMPAASFLENFFALSYGIGDLILIIPALLVLKTTLDYGQGRLFGPWMFIFHGFVFTLVGDLLFAIYYNQYKNLVWPYTLIDLAWIISYLCFTYGFFGIIAALSAVQRKMKLSA